MMMHRHQADLPEDVEEEEIERHEDAQHARLQEKEHEEVFLHPMLDVPRKDDAEAGERRRQRSSGRLKPSTPEWQTDRDRLIHCTFVAI